MHKALFHSKMHDASVQQEREAGVDRVPGIAPGIYACQSHQSFEFSEYFHVLSIDLLNSDTQCTPWIN